MNKNFQSARPLVSVIIPFHDDLEYIQQALDSCLQNTYPRMEIIIVDDHSEKPLTREEVSAAGHKYPITIFRNDRNRGSGYARNVGIKAAQGELIAFLDADDIWFPDIIQKQVSVFQSDPSAVWVYTDGYYLIDEKRKRRPNSRYHGFRKGFPAGKEVNEYHLKGYNYMTFSSNMMKKEALLAVGLFDEGLDVSEDWDLFVRLAERFPVHVINEPLMVYRVNNSGRHFVNREKYVDVNLKILKDMYERQGLWPKRLKDFDRAAAMIYQRAGIQRLNAGLNAEAREFLFHPRCSPLAWYPRMIVLRILSLLPGLFYKAALWVYDKTSFETRS
ncbi:MAG: glycosyltransferase family A protein [Candidatus Omnitrophota bacterium]